MATSHATAPRHTRRKSPMPAARTATRAAAPTDGAAPAVPRERIDPETRRRMIAEAAYYCAERRGFEPGGELADWLEAEAQLEAGLR